VVVVVCNSREQLNAVHQLRLLLCSLCSLDVTTADHNEQRVHLAWRTLQVLLLVVTLRYSSATAGGDGGGV
jgi:hypothetical protein